MIQFAYSELEMGQVSMWLVLLKISWDNGFGDVFRGPSGISLVMSLVNVARCSNCTTQPELLL